MCAAPAVVLEAHGLLKSKKATAHPAFVNKLSDTRCNQILSFTVLTCLVTT